MFLKIFSSILYLTYILIRPILVTFRISFLRNILYIYILTDIPDSIFSKAVRSGSGILQSLLPYGFLLLLTELLQILTDAVPVTLQDQNYDETAGFPYNYANVSLSLLPHMPPYLQLISSFQQRSYLH